MEVVQSALDTNLSEFSKRSNTVPTLSAVEKEHKQHRPDPIKDANKPSKRPESSKQTAKQQRIPGKKPAAPLATTMQSAMKTLQIVVCNLVLVAIVFGVTCILFLHGWITNDDRFSFPTMIELLVITGLFLPAGMPLRYCFVRFVLKKKLEPRVEFPFGV